MTRNNGEALNLLDTPYKIPFLRTLYSFRGEACLEHYSSLTVLPGQLMRILGFSMGALMREALGASGWKQLQYALKKQHRLSKTSRAVVSKSLGPLGSSFLEAIDEGESALLENSSPWGLFTSQWSGPRDAIATGLERACAYLSSLEAMRSAAAQRSDGRTLSPEQQVFDDFTKESVSEWGVLLGSSTMQAAPLLTSTLRALAELDIGVSTFLGKRTESLLMKGYLEGRYRPLTHWIHRVQVAYGVSNNQALSDKLLAKGVFLVQGNGPRPITRATLAKWASGSQLARPAAVQVLLGALADKDKIATLTIEYFVARGLLFLVQAVGGLSSIELSPEEAQDELRARYLATFNALSNQYASTF